MCHFLLWCFGLARPETQTTAAERECLRRHAENRRSLVEIGVWHGVSTVELQKVMAPSGVIFAVDPFPPGRLGFSTARIIAQSETEKGPGRIQWLRLTSVQAGAWFEKNCGRTVDFIFIDGDHSYQALREDWTMWAPLIVPGGIAALHDSTPSASRQIAEPGSVRATKEIIAVDPRFTWIETVDTLTIWQCKTPSSAL